MTNAVIVRKTSAVGKTETSPQSVRKWIEGMFASKERVVAIRYVPDIRKKAWHD